MGLHANSQVWSLVVCVAHSLSSGTLASAFVQSGLLSELEDAGLTLSEAEKLLPQCAFRRTFRRIITPQNKVPYEDQYIVCCCSSGGNVNFKNLL